MKIAHVFGILMCSVATMSYAATTTLEGSTVSAALYCCSAPAETSRISNVVSATVGSQVEFPINTFTFLSDGSTWSEGSIDIGPTTLSLDLFTSGVTNSGAFNGFIFSFTGAPSIIGVAVNPASSLVPTSAFYNSNEIFLHFDAVPYSVGSNVTLDVTLQPVPLPAAAWLFGSALLGLAGMGRRRPLN